MQMNKILKIHLILATILSISCNSWSTNPNNNINSINETNINNNISEINLNNIDVNQMSNEQCDKIFNTKCEQFKNNTNTLFIMLCNSLIKIYNIIYEQHNTLINEFLDKYSKYDNKYITINSSNIAYFKNINNLLVGKNKLEIGSKVKWTKLLQDMRNEVYNYMQQYIMNFNTKENDIINQCKKMKEIVTNSKRIGTDFTKMRYNYNSEIRKCYDKKEILNSFVWIGFTGEQENLGNCETISQVFYNLQNHFLFLSNIEEILETIINYDIIPYNERNNMKIDLRYFDSYKAPSGFKSKAVGFKYYYNLTDNFIDMLFKISKCYWYFNNLKEKQHAETFEQKLLSLCLEKRNINDYIKEVIDTLDTKKIAVQHKDGKYVSKVLKITKKLKRSLENIVQNALFENDKIEQTICDREMLRIKTEQKQKEKENPMEKIRKRKIRY